MWNSQLEGGSSISGNSSSNSWNSSSQSGTSSSTNPAIPASSIFDDSLLPGTSSKISWPSSTSNSRDQDVGWGGGKQKGRNKYKKDHVMVTNAFLELSRDCTLYRMWPSPWRLTRVWITWSPPINTYHARARPLHVRVDNLDPQSPCWSQVLFHPQGGSTGKASLLMCCD